MLQQQHSVQYTPGARYTCAAQYYSSELYNWQAASHQLLRALSRARARTCAALLSVTMID